MVPEGDAERGREHFLNAVFGALPIQTGIFLSAIALLMVTLNVFRLAFMWVNWDAFSGSTTGEIGLAFLNGARFDLHIIMIITGMFFLVLHFPGPWKFRLPLVRLVSWPPILAFLPALAMVLINIHYYNESGRHLSYEIFSVSQDRNELAASLEMVFQYRWSILAYIIICVFLVLIWKGIIGRVFRVGGRMSLKADAIWLSIFLVILYLGLRGTVTGRPLRMSHAFIQDRVELGHLSLNPLFTMARSLSTPRDAVPAPYSESEAVQTVRSLLGTSETVWHGEDAPMYRRIVHPEDRNKEIFNIVFIVLESWSVKYVGAYGNPENITPEFDKLAEEGLLFENFYAVGNRTDEGLAAMCLGIPAFNHNRNPGRGAFLSGSLELNRYMGIGKIMGQRGYSSVYMHGEKSRTFRQASIARLGGFDKHLGSGELGLTPEETKGPWGGWDHVLLEKLSEVLTGEPEPFLVLWISLSNHEPYSLPDDIYKTVTSKDNEGKFMDSMRYTDHYLGRFFQRIRDEEFFSRTIFLITADHSARVISSMEKRYHIPLIIYAPGIVQAGVSRKVGSQLDIIPTVLDLLGLDSGHHAMGNSLLDEKKGGFAVLNFSQGYGWVSGTDLLEVDPDGDLVGSSQIRSLLLPSEDAILRRQKLLSFLQVGHRLLMEDRFVPRF